MIIFINQRLTSDRMYCGCGVFSKWTMVGPTIYIVAFRAQYIRIPCIEKLSIFCGSLEQLSGPLP
jgi:hypothetical protein